MNRGALRDKIRKQLGETTASFWTDAELNGWIDSSIRDVAWRTKCCKKTSLMTPTASVAEYDLSTYFTDLLHIIEVYFYSNSTWNKLDRIDRVVLDRDYPGWLSATAALTDHYSYDVEQDWFLLWPAPSSTYAGTQYVKVYHTYYPAALSADDSLPETPAVLDDVIMESVKAVAFESRGMGDRANNSRQMFINMVKDYKIQRNLEDDEEIIMRAE